MHVQQTVIILFQCGLTPSDESFQVGALSESTRCAGPTGGRALVHVLAPQRGFSSFADSNIHVSVQLDASGQVRAVSNTFRVDPVRRPAPEVKNGTFLHVHGISTWVAGRACSTRLV